jgi:hypothetical protein
MTKQQKLILFGGLALTSATYLAYNTIRRNQIFTELTALINKGSARSNKRVEEVLSGTFHKDVKSMNPDKEFILLGNDSVKDFAVSINEALKGWGTDESALNRIIKSIRDKVAFSQVASFYNIKFNQSLVDELKSELSQEDYLKFVVIPINLKKDVRWQ